MRGLIERLTGRPAAESATRDPADDFWYGQVTRPAAAGMVVTPATTIQLPVAWDCLNVLSDTVAALPFHVHRQVGDATRRSVENHPLNRLLHDDFETRKQQVWDLASAGNWFAEPVGGRRGLPDELAWIPPDEMVVQRTPNGVVRYKFQDSGGRQQTRVEGEIWHIKRPPLLERGLVGTSPIAAGREAIAAALAVQDYGARFFANDCTPPFVIEHPGNFAEAKDRQNFLAALKRWWGGSRRHSPGILEWGMKLSKVGTENEKAQFLETRKESSYDVARIWRMPPHKVGLMEKATFSNIEQQALEFVTDTLLPWLTLIEKWYKRNLLTGTGQDDLFCEHNVAGLLRGDIKARYEAYAQARNWGWLSVNDIRNLENMNPIAGGDVYLQPLNMAPAGSTPARDADASVLDASGRTASALIGGQWHRADAPVTFENVVKIEDYRHAA